MGSSQIRTRNLLIDWIIVEEQIVQEIISSELNEGFLWALLK